MTTLPPGVRITGQTFEVYDWKAYMNNPKAQRQLAALGEVKIMSVEDSLRRRIAELERNNGQLIADNVNLTAENNRLRESFSELVRNAIPYEEAGGQYLVEVRGLAPVPPS